MIVINDFSFLIGRWKVLNRKLTERLKGCDEWIEFQAEMHTKSILNGLGIMDEMKTSHLGSDFIGFSLRMLNPKTNEWTIYWADTFNAEIGLKEQVVGRFNHGKGEFFGKEVYRDKEVKLRFIWKKLSLETAQWEQAYYDEIKNEWETNWVMTFTRID